MLCMKEKFTSEILFLLLLNVTYSKVILFIFSKVLSNFKISWTSNFGSKIWAKLQAKPNFSSQFLRVSEILKFAKVVNLFLKFVI